MYETLHELLRNLSSGPPLIWAFSVVLSIAGTGLLLHFFWEAVLKGIGTFARSHRPSGRSPSGSTGPSTRLD